MCYTIKHVLIDLDEPAQIHPRFQILAEKRESGPDGWAQQYAAIRLIPSQQPASWRRQPIPRRRPKGFDLDFLPPTIPIYIDCIKIQLEKQWDTCNCILIQWWRGWLVTWVLQIMRLVSNVKYPATITLSRTEINTKHTYYACTQT